MIRCYDLDSVIVDLYAGSMDELEKVSATNNRWPVCGFLPFEVEFYLLTDCNGSPFYTTYGFVRQVAEGSNRSDAWVLLVLDRI